MLSHNMCVLVLAILADVSRSSTTSIPTSSHNDTTWSPAPQQNLIHYLLTERRYDPDVHPMHNYSQAAQVTIDLMLSEVIALDIRRQIFEVSVWVRLYWRDDALVWDPEKYNNITKITILPLRVWRPDIVVYNLAEGRNHELWNTYPVTVTYDGHMAWLFPDFIYASCRVNVRRFPWDNQTCFLEYGSWTQDMDSIYVKAKRNVVDTLNYSPNGEYKLTGTSATEWIDLYDNGKSGFTMVKFSFYLERKTLYYLNTIIMPSILVSILAGTVFLVPPGGGEKVSLAITVMLASTVFLLVVGDATPVQSDYVPILGNFFTWMLSSLAMTTIMAVIVVGFNRKGAPGKPVPHCMKVVFFKYLAPIACLRHSARDLLKREEEKRSKVGLTEVKSIRTESHENETMSGQKNTDLLAGKVDSIMAHTETMAWICSHNDIELIVATQWSLVAQIIDRLFFIIFIILFIAMIFFLFIQ